MVNYNLLIKEAQNAREYSYSPYSNFKVGCALLCKNGKIYTGCNVENASFGECICAERAAIVKAISQGDKEFSAIAIVGGIDEICDFTYPCGSCRQVMSEFCESSLEIVLFNGKEIKLCTLGQLFPNSFDKKSIK